MNVLEQGMAALEQKLKDEIAKGRAASHALREFEEAKMAENNIKLVGKTFVYDNAYNSDEHWPRYVKITGLSGSHPRIFAFEERTDRHIEIQHDYVLTIFNGSYIEIPNEVFSDEWEKLKAKIAELQP